MCCIWLEDISYIVLFSHSFFMSIHLFQHHQNSHKNINNTFRSFFSLFSHDHNHKISHEMLMYYQFSNFTNSLLHYHHWSNCQQFYKMVNFFLKKNVSIVSFINMKLILKENPFLFIYFVLFVQQKKIYRVRVIIIIIIATIIWLFNICQ